MKRVILTLALASSSAWGAVPCPDPGIALIEYTLVQRSAPFRGIVRITVNAKNFGAKRYLSGIGQQEIHLYEGSTLVARRSFTNLAANEQVALKYIRRWDASSPGEGEFPPLYTAYLVYDPDIRLDGNPDNDDCRTFNNRLRRPSWAVNDLFH